MAILYVLMTAVGLALLFWGFWAAHNAKKPLDIIGTLAILAGFVTAILGTLLLCVPGFFSSVGA